MVLNALKVLPMNVKKYGEPSKELKEGWKQQGWKEGDSYPSVQYMKLKEMGNTNYHGEPLSYEYDNGDHKVVTTDKDGKKIGELLAKDIAPNTVEVVSNQVYDEDLRGKGRGVDQIQHLLEKVGDDISLSRATSVRLKMREQLGTS